ncbi:MAG: hypothetical protein CMM47_06760 [Rhodospirillaceae bacterium]|nr:hypothetical protein [Rhodospirillaceae bacterium]
MRPNATMAVVMRIECPECSMAFNVPDGAIKAKGRKLRCSRCEHQWTQYPTLTDQKPQKKKPQTEALNGGEPDAAPSQEAGSPALEEGGERPDAHLEENQDPPTFDTLDGDIVEDDGLEPFDAPPIGRRLLLGSATQRLRQSSIITIAALLLFMIVIPLGLVFSRASLVSVMPGFSPVFDAIGLHVPVTGEHLVIQNVGVCRKVEGEVEVMLIKGEIHNDSDTMQPMPVLRGTIEDANGNPLQSAPYTVEAAILVPGDTVEFRYQIPRPNPLAAQVTITFSDDQRQSDFGY